MWVYIYIYVCVCVCVCVHICTEMPFIDNEKWFKHQK